MKLKNLLWTPLLTLALCATPAQAEELTVSINGRICYDMNLNGKCDKGELGVSGVTVTAVQPVTLQTATTFTDAEGKYQLIGLTSGLQYDLSVTASGKDLSQERNVFAPVNDCLMTVRPVTVLFIPVASR